MLLKLLGILLQSSCAARAGDIALSSAYKGRECLCWRHVTITIADREKPLSVQNLLLKFELEFTKGHKNASNESRVVYITPLQDPSLNAVCVVKALLVVALRLGRVNYTTLDEVLYEASQRFDGTVQWKDPQAPVLCQLPYGDSSRFVGLAARPEQIRSALRELSLNAGLLARVNTHDLRSGALRDIAHLDAIPKGVADSTTTLIAGHSSNTMAKGITQEYVGHMQQPIWNLRAESSFQSRLDPSFAPAPMSKAKMPRGEVDAYLDLHEGDKGDVGARNRASASLRRDKHNTFIQETKASSVQMPSPKAQPLRKRTASQMNIEAGLQESRKKPKIADDAAKGNSLSARALSMEKQDQDTDNIDPELLDMDEGQRRDLEYIEGLIVHDATDQDSASALREADDNMVITELTDEMPTAVEQDPDDFVKWLSTINVFSGKDFRSTIQQLPTGNSLEAPTVFLHACSKCDYSTADRKYRDAHELHCTGTLPSARLRCEYEGCGKTYKNKRSLQTHVRNGHKFTPQACTRCPDDKKDEIFTSNNDLLNHVRQCHRNVDVDEPILCPYQGEDGCTMSNPFAHAESLGSHLQRIHKKSPTDIASAKRATGASSMERWQATCPVPTCTDDTIFTEAAGFTSHLCNAHHFAYKSEDVKMYLAQVRGRTSS